MVLFWFAALRNQVSPGGLLPRIVVLMPFALDDVGCWVGIFVNGMGAGLKSRQKKALSAS